MLLVGIHVNRRSEISFFAKKYIEILRNNHIDYRVLDINSLGFWENLQNCTHFIYQWGGSPDSNNPARSIMPVIENTLKIPVYPGFKTTWHHDDKIRQYYLLKAKGFPVIDSWVFWEKQYALEWLKNKATYPLVFKLKSSAGSQDVVLIKNYSNAKKIAKKIFGSGILLGHIPGNQRIKQLDFSVKKSFDKLIKKSYRWFKGRDISIQWQREKNYVLFQKFLPSNDYDTRITIIGDRALAFRRFNRDKDFRSSGSGKIDYDMSKIDPVFLKLAFEITKTLGFQSMAYDFLWDNGVPAICEMSYTYLDSAIYNCPGYWDSNLNWHEGHHWPQVFILRDLLKMPELQQPDFSVMAVHENKNIFNYLQNR